MKRLYLIVGLGLMAITLFGAGALTAAWVINTDQGQVNGSMNMNHMSMMAGADGVTMSPADWDQHAAMHSGMMSGDMMGGGMMDGGMMGDADMMPHSGSCPFQQATPTP